MFSKFIRHHLAEQHRSDDPEHNAFVQKLAKGKPISVEDILKYDFLSKKDVEDSPDEWKFAPVIVSTNMERLNISRMQAIEWAKQHKTHVFKWKNKLGIEQNRPPENEMKSGIEDANAFFWQYWVKDAECYLSYNINGELALVNGAPMRCHSLTFESPEDFNHVQDNVRGESQLPFGSEIEISEPLSVNMAICESLDDKPVSFNRRAQLNQLRKFSIGPEGGEIVIPITKQMNKKSNNMKKFKYETRNMMLPIATAAVVEPFPFDLAFSMTVHKAQGRTISRVIVDLTCHPVHTGRMEFAAVFVAMSRVKCKKHLRLLPRPAQNHDKSYKYLEKLKPLESVMTFYSGYEGSLDQGHVWNWKKALCCKN